MQQDPSAPSKKSAKSASRKTATKKTAKKRVTRTAKKAKRYTDELKQEIIDFVENFGRGGATKAAKKFGVSPLSISNWKKKLGRGGKSSGVKSAKTRATSKPGSRDQILAKMTKLSAEMAANEQKHAAMQKEFEQLKAML